MASARPAARLAGDLLRLAPRRPTPLDIIPTRLPQPTTSVSTTCGSLTVRIRSFHDHSFFTPTPSPNPRPPQYGPPQESKHQQQSRAAPTGLAVGAGVAALASYLYNRARDTKSKIKANIDNAHTDRAKDPDKEPPPSSDSGFSIQTNSNDEDTREPLSLPRYNLSDIRTNHSSNSSSPWVTYADKVYDITDWVGAHPGGDVILRAAGGPIEPYWDIFTIHKNSPYVRDILEQYCVGYIHMDDLDRATKKPKMDEIEDPFAQDPERDSRLVTHTAKPRNAETPSDFVASEFKTGEELFYVRHHMWVPVVDSDGAPVEGKHVLSVELPDGETRGYTLKELKERFRRHKVTATLQCSGNRRNDMTRHAGKTNGLQWGVGAISNAEWEGVLLRDVLRDAGLKVKDPSTVTAVSGPSMSTSSEDEADLPSQKDLHVHFNALEAYGASIPLTKALDPTGDVLLAFRMNGHALPRDHGFPLRAIVPGHVAARSVKWLSKIVVSDEESPSQWQRRDYKSFGPNEGANPDWDKAKSIQEMPVTSAITGVWVGSDCLKNKTKNKDMNDKQKTTVDLADVDGQKVGCTKTTTTTPTSPAEIDTESRKKIPITMQGYAYSGGGRAIARVDVSLDNGRTWDQAELIDDCANPETPCYGNKTWTWKRWKYSATLPPSVLPSPSLNSTSPGSGPSSSSSPSGEEDGKKKCTTLIVKAVDEAYNTQPESHAGIYNVRGNLATAWHRVRICPECVKCPDGGSGVKWMTGKVVGCGFEKESEVAREKKIGETE